MKNGTKYRIVAAALLGLAAVNSRGWSAAMAVDSLTGPVTSHEIKAFNDYMETVTAPARGDRNVWVYGGPGKAIEACGSMFEVTADPAILDRMIYFCDASLAGRNDLASPAEGGQRIVWTGKVEPIWPSSPPTVRPAGGGVEQGEVVAHMAYCAKLILENRHLWDKPVPIGDPHGFGATYLARAKTYIAQGDHVIDAWILPHFIKVSDHNHYWFPGAPNTYKPNEPAPWNQAWMLSRGLIRLTECHVLLADDPARVAKYDAIVQSNIDWFFASLRPQTSAAGTTCWSWVYSLVAPKAVEDTNHAAYDTGGLFVAYESGRYGLTRKDMIPFANTYVDTVMATTHNGRFAGRVDGSTGVGHAGGDNYVRDEYLYLSEYRPDAFAAMGNAEIAAGKVASSPPITARLLWEKDRRYRRFALACDPVEQAIASGSSVVFRINVSSLGGFTGHVRLTIGDLPSGMAASFSPTPEVAAPGSVVMNLTTSKTTAAGVYSLVVKGEDGTLAHTVNVTVRVGPMAKE